MDGKSISGNECTSAEEVEICTAILTVDIYGLAKGYLLW